MTSGAAIFDMDGTLVDNMPLHIECWIALFWEEGRAVTVHPAEQLRALPHVVKVVTDYAGLSLRELITGGESE